MVKKDYKKPSINKYGTLTEITRGGGELSPEGDDYKGYIS